MPINLGGKTHTKSYLKMRFVLVIWYITSRKHAYKFRWEDSYEVVSENEVCTSYLIHYITKTCLYNFDPLKPHFYIVKLGFTGVYIIFHISAQNIDCGYSLEPPRRSGSNEYTQSIF